jgi:hypothetical protein
MFNTNTLIQIPPGDIPYKPKNHGEMCGKVEVEKNDVLPASPLPRVVYVRFLEGEYTKWHYHHGIQVLLVS